MRGEVDPIEALPSLYWWSKLKLQGSLLVGPLLIIGWLGIFQGHEWGRACVYVFTAIWMSNKVFYLFLKGVDGVFEFSLAMGMAVLLVLVVRSKSWSAWIERD